MSNFQVAHLERLASETDTVPAVNQIEAHPYFTNDEVRRLRSGARYRNRSVVADCAGVRCWTTIPSRKSRIRSAKTAAQVVLRWHIQRGDIIFPKSVTPSRIEENFAIFDFELDSGDMDTLTALNKGEEGCVTGPNPDTFDYIPD